MMVFGGLKRMCLAVVLLASAFAFAETREVVILHVNDSHGELFAEDKDPDGKKGGIARAATVIKGLREETEGRSLLLHAGDILSSTNPITIHYAGECNFRALNLMGFDAYTPGNGEFYWGIECILKQARAAEFSVLHANVVYRKNHELLFEPYTVKDVNGVRVGILGLGVIRPGLPKVRQLTLRNYRAAAEEFVPLLREKADLVIVLSHLGTDWDTDLASRVPGVDIIVGGHNHDVFEEPVRVAGPTGEVVLTRAGEYWHYIGRLAISMKREDGKPWSVERIDGTMIPVTDEAPEDPEIRALLAEYGESLREVLCVAKTTFENPDEGYSPAGSLVAGAVFEATGVDVALIGRGAVRSAIEEGEVTLGDVYRIHTWRNEVMLLDLTGAEVLAVLEEAPGLHLGGETAVSSTQPTTLHLNGEPVLPEKVYRVAVNDYLYATTKALKNKPAKPTGRLVHEVLEEYLRNQMTIECSSTADRSE